MSYAEQSLPAANEAYVAAFGDKGSLPLPPGKRVAIVGCMDARLDTFGATGLHEGDAHHIRNAGGRASDALRSLVISQELLGTREVIVIHHTDCGMLTFRSDQLHGLVKKRVAHEHFAAVDSLACLEFPDVDESIKEDVAFLKNHPLILPETVISGYRYEVETGKLVKIA
uniref:Carbonic anhydrase n=1 Tax=Glaciozyma antarctica TaxID=105987 RepID=A0A384E115_9BASI|nr:Chain A, carbonic anhydrase [Glaciozyma antarctica]5ZTP_B Chain B, carbonic anhydrase [Glaciozyma antarctica]